MTISEQDLNPAEVLRLAAAGGLHIEEGLVDKPEVTERLETLKAIIQTRERLLAEAKAERIQMHFRLLPDDEQARIIQWATDYPSGKLPDVDADVPVTPCPDWCESNRCENGQGKYHEGAITRVEGVNWKTGVRADYRSADMGVSIDSETGRPVLNIHADVDLDYDGAMDLSIGLVKAALLFKDLGVPTDLPSIRNPRLLQRHGGGGSVMSVSGRYPSPVQNAVRWMPD